VGKIQIKSVLFDTNIILDIVFLRGEHSRQSMDAIACAQRNGLKIIIAAASYNVISYIGARVLGKLQVMKALERIRIMFETAALDGGVIDKALVSDFDDFEDALQYYSAVDAGAGCVVTRDKKGFKTAGIIQVFSPEEFISRMKR
jgi:predicted nucleic acid-binding protein